MSRVEVSKSQGTHVITSLVDVRQPEYSAALLVSTYTKHGYQVVPEAIQANTNIAFIIWATNDEKKNWVKIAQYNIQGAGKGGRNKSGVLYHDMWNYKYSRCSLLGDFTGGENFRVLEKHNA